MNLSSTVMERFNARRLGEGPVVVLGHGFGADQTAWHSQVDALRQQGYACVLFDFAGATEHTLPAYQSGRHNSLYGFAEDLVTLLRGMKVRDALYVGHSLGGMVGLLASNGEPGLFRAMCLLASSACYIDDPETGYVGGFTRGQIAQLQASMLQDYTTWANGFAPMVVADPERPLLALEFTRRLMLLRPDMAVKVLSAAFLSDHRPDVEKVAVPIRVLQTEFDPAVPMAAARWLAAHARAERFEVIPTLGHFPHWTAAAEVNASLLDFAGSHVGT